MVEKKLQELMRHLELKFTSEKYFMLINLSEQKSPVNFNFS